MGIFAAKYRLAIAGMIIGTALAAFLILSLMLVSARSEARDARDELATERASHSITRSSLGRATLALSNHIDAAEAQQAAAARALEAHGIRDAALGRDIAAIRAERSTAITQQGTDPPPCITPPAIISAKGL